ncbi:MAG: hypothetical protein KatS3mg073_0514 [Meiothermus sp.]|nr:MAG: hypothetical protein KatS3mg073_0514 [Meiothermus sp.]
MKVPLGQLFWAFLQVGLVAFGGGGNAQLYQALVLRRAWMAEREFLETTALCRILPGPVFANTAAHLGMRLGGVVGGCAGPVGRADPWGPADAPPELRLFPLWCSCRARWPRVL